MELWQYEAVYTQGLTLLTCSTVNREPVLEDPQKVNLLRTVLQQVKEDRPFRTIAYAMLPEHFHLLAHLEQPNSADQLVREMGSQYAGAYQQILGFPGKLAIWQSRAEMRTVEDVTAFAAYLDAIHYDPVRHGHVARPEEWLHTSYETWVERGLYKLGWGWTEPESVRSIVLD